MKKSLKRIQLLALLGVLLSTTPKLVKADTDLSFLEVAGNPEYIDDLITFIQSLDDNLVDYLNQCGLRIIILVVLQGLLFMIVWIIMLYM